ncbi:MAG TPA: hypothetical protein VIG99_22790 [Myxococcaceae bacterium]|jgi:hypothetical protein
MLALLAMAPLLACALPGEEDEEPVTFLLTTDLGTLPRVGLELEAPMTSWGSAFVWFGYPIPGPSSGRDGGPQIAGGWRAFLFGRAPWGLFFDARLQIQSYFPLNPREPSPTIIPGAGLSLGLNAKLWRMVLSPGVGLFYVPDPVAASPVLPVLRLAFGIWN